MKWWFKLPPSRVPWPQRWYRLYVIYSVPSVRFVGYRVVDWDSGPVPMLGFWFFHLAIDR